jgi:hypothetical protein
MRELHLGVLATLGLFTAALLLLYCCFTTSLLRYGRAASRRARYALPPYCCFTAAFLLLYYCFTTASLLLYLGMGELHLDVLATLGLRTAALLLLFCCFTWVCASCT